MKQLFLFILFGLSLQGYAQSPWSFGVGFSPDFCFRTLSADGNSARWKSFRDDNEIIKLGYTAGFYVKKQLDLSFSLETGLAYSNKGYMRQMDLIFGSDIDPSGINPTVPSRFTGLYHFKYLDVPLKLNFLLSEWRRTRLHLSSGFVLNVFLEQKNVTEYTEAGQHHREVSYGEGLLANGPVNISPFLGLGFDIKLSEMTRIQIEPMFRHAILPAHLDDGVETRLWTSGLNVVLYKTL